MAGEYKLTPRKKDNLTTRRRQFVTRFKITSFRLPRLLESDVSGIFLPDRTYKNRFSVVDFDFLTQPIRVKYHPILDSRDIPYWKKIKIICRPELSLSLQNFSLSERSEYSLCLNSDFSAIQKSGTVFGIYGKNVFSFLLYQNNYFRDIFRLVSYIQTRVRKRLRRTKFNVYSIRPYYNFCNLFPKVRAHSYSTSLIAVGSEHYKRDLRKFSTVFNILGLFKFIFIKSKPENFLYKEFVFSSHLFLKYSVIRNTFAKSVFDFCNDLCSRMITNKVRLKRIFRNFLIYKKVYKTASLRCIKTIFAFAKGKKKQYALYSKIRKKTIYKKLRQQIFQTTKATKKFKKYFVAVNRLSREQTETSKVSRQRSYSKIAVEFRKFLKPKPKPERKISTGWNKKEVSTVSFSEKRYHRKARSKQAR